MKRFTAILFCLMYTLSVFGFNVNFHYCGGKIKYVKIILHKENSCCKSELEVSSCCADERMFHQVDDKHQVSQLNFEDIKIKLEVPNYFVSEVQPIENYSNDLQLHELDHPPPEGDKRVMQCSLIYYG